jgi:hypothetical protein
MADNKDIVTVRTETGSCYELNRATFSWRRRAATGQSGCLFTEQGQLKRWPEIKVGERMNLESKSLFFGDFGTRLTSTSLVTEITEA